MVARLLAVVVLTVALHAAPAGAQEPGTTTTTTLAELPAPHIVPRPNSGEEPHDPGDRGGALQLTVLGLLVVALGGAVAMVVRQSRRARAESDAS
ncbi:MAG: hypothetical protein ACJ739_11845 [Acidimicrobiales bacterium]